MSKDQNLVLVVDDDPGMLRAVKRLLRQHDYEPILFSSAHLSKATPISRRRLASFSTST
jgi:FixJ family two-component response regulator